MRNNNNKKVAKMARPTYVPMRRTEEALERKEIPQNGWLQLDRSTSRYIYKAKNGKLLVVLSPSQKAQLILEQYIQTLFNKDLF